MPAKRPTRKTKNNLNVETNSFLKALMFVNQAQSKTGLDYEKHCYIKDGWVLAYNGCFSAGAKVPFNFTACPQTAKLIAAISSCTGELSIVQDDSSITIKSGRFKAHVDCVKPETMPFFPADKQIAVLSDKIKECFSYALVVISESGEKYYERSLLLQANTIVATDGKRLIECWHGVDLPSNLVIPYKTARAVVGKDSPLTGFGYSENSVTFHFEDESFIKTSLLLEKYLDYAKVIESSGVFDPLPDDFILGIKTVLPFTDEGILLLNTDKILSSKDEKKATTFEVEPLPENKSFNGNFIVDFEKHLNRVQFANDRMFFFGENVRGVIMGCRL